MGGFHGSHSTHDRFGQGHAHAHDRPGRNAHRHGHHYGPGLIHDHVHAASGQIIRLQPQLSRRVFLNRLGKGTMAAAILSPALLAACSSGTSGAETTTAAASSAPNPTAKSDPAATEAPDPTASPDTAADGTDNPDTAGKDTAGSAEARDLVWARANLGFVSAYVLVRGNTAAIVDTGVSGSAIAIGETLQTLGLNYSDVEHVILTHAHGDHAGSIGEVMVLANNATAYAGESDVSAIAAELTALSGGEDIFGFEMVPTPGHTAGHMAAIDHTAGVLVAGDAIFGEGDKVVEGPERFFDDIPLSRESIRTMAQLSFNTLLFGHGDPIESGADAAVAALAATF